MSYIEAINNAISLIKMIEGFDRDILDFISDNSEFFSAIPVRSLIASEYISKKVISESAYIYLIGSFMYYSISGESVLWLHRRRFAKFCYSDDWNTLFKKTLSSSPLLRFKTLEELTQYLHYLLSISD